MNVNGLSVNNGSADRRTSLIEAVYISPWPAAVHNARLRCSLSPLDAIIKASFASHSRAALSATASKTGWKSVGELAMTPRISLVAVCCSNASRELLEQPHVLDRDHRLVGKGFKQTDLLVRERTKLQATKVDYPKRNSISQQRHN